MCEAKSEGLVRYPTTLAPENGLTLVILECGDNAHKAFNTILATCFTYGVWSNDVDPPYAPATVRERCRSNTGYHQAMVNGKEICQDLLTVYLVS